MATRDKLGSRAYLVYTGLVVGGVVAGLPFVWMLMASFMTRGETLRRTVLGTLNALDRELAWGFLDNRPLLTLVAYYVEEFAAARNPHRPRRRPEAGVHEDGAAAVPDEERTEVERDRRLRVRHAQCLRPVRRLDAVEEAAKRPVWRAV